MIEQFSILGLSPALTFVLGMLAAILVYVIKILIERIGKDRDRKLDMLQEETKRTCVFIRRIGGLIRHFNHSVMHVVDGEKEYAVSLERYYKEIRELARENYDQVKNEHPSLLKNVEEYTDLGRAVMRGETDYFTFNRAQAKLGEVLDEIFYKHCR